MSFDALAWAAKQSCGSSGAKLVLLGLAECANRKNNLAFPSIAELVEFSDLDRKSVIANLARLEERGLIVDTGRRCGRTKQIKVYELLIGTVPKTEPYQKRNSSDFSAKSTENGTRNLSEPVSEANASGCADPMKELFDVGVALLTANGHSEREARSLVGKWRKDNPPEKILAAFIECRSRAISNPVEWLTKRFANAPKFVSATGYEYRGSLEQILREADKRGDNGTYWSVKRAIEQQRAAA